MSHYLRPLGLGMVALMSMVSAGAATGQTPAVRKLPKVPTDVVQSLTNTKRMTRFDPSVNGFHFRNAFQTVTGVFDITTGGLCGGMVYAALDYFNKGQAAPAQTYTPVNGTQLQSYIYARHMTSLERAMPKWVELHANPLGARNAEFFNWGLQGTGGGRLQELRAEIDAGRPVPLGLKSLDADPSNDHVVLAIGYDMGRYRGDLGANKEDLKIFIYDPNSGNRMVTLYPVPSEAKYCMDSANGTKCFRTYFVMKNAWTPQTPPAISDHPKELILTIGTGGDDLRGGNDNLSVSLNLKNGGRIEASNVNMGQRWIDHSDQTVGVSLPEGLASQDIQSVTLRTSFGGGMGGDNWNLDTLTMVFRDNGVNQARCTLKGSPLTRFTGDRKSETYPFACR